MTRPDPNIRPLIHLSPIAETPPDPNQWWVIAATVFFAIGFAMAVQI